MIMGTYGGQHRPSVGMSIHPCPNECLHWANNNGPTYEGPQRASLGKPREELPNEHVCFLLANLRPLVECFPSWPGT